MYCTCTHTCIFDWFSNCNSISVVFLLLCQGHKYLVFNESDDWPGILAMGIVSVVELVALDFPFSRSIWLFVLVHFLKWQRTSKYVNNKITRTVAITPICINVDPHQRIK